MFVEFFTHNHALLFTAIFVLGIVVAVFLGICYWMGDLYLKEERENDPNYKQPQKYNKNDSSDS